MKTFEMSEVAVIRVIERITLTTIWDKGLVTAEEVVQHVQKVCGADHTTVESLVSQHIAEMLDAYCLEIQYHCTDDLNYNLNNIADCHQVITLDASWSPAKVDTELGSDDGTELNNYSDELSLHHWFQDDMYALQYGERYTRKIENLKELLLHKETGKGQFRVVGVEAGLGKSLYVNRIIQDHIDSF